MRLEEHNRGQRGIESYGNMSNKLLIKTIERRMFLNPFFPIKEIDLKMDMFLFRKSL
jgi:hypothetical protein